MRLSQHTPESRETPAPVWWFAAANCAVALVVSLGFHAILSLVTERWWAHALIAPFFFMLSLGIVHHALCGLINPVVQVVFRRTVSSESMPAR